MSAANFAPAVALELREEGGLVNNPKDPGGITNRGVTLPAMTEFLGRQASARDIVDITSAQAAQIYHKLYWPAVRGDDCPDGVDLMLFDEAINAGRGRAVQHLQQALRMSVVDRVFGAATLAAVLAADPSRLIDAIRAEREAFYRSLSTFVTFGTGWISRLDLVAREASEWAATNQA